MMEFRAGSAGPFTILVVDDDDGVREFICRALRDGSRAILSARHSDEALLLSEEYAAPIHLLLTDVAMDPFMDGCELAKCMRLLRPEIHVLYISGADSNQVVRQEVMDGRAEFLAKPIPLAALLEKVEAILTSAGRRH